MKTLLRSLVFFAVIQTANAQTFNPVLAELLQDTLNYYVTAITNIKGMSASVYVPGQGIWRGTAGLNYAAHPITSDMKFGIASNTKLFVATVMLKLQENNILDLDDAISTYLPNYTNINPAITIRQLLNHTSGVQDPLFAAPWMDTINNNATRVFTPTEVLGWVGAPTFAPGAGWGYSNINYILAGMIAENATGYHISQLIRDSILTPLNMDSTFYDVEEAPIGTVSHRWWNSIDYNDTSRVGINTAGGCAGALFSTAGEMVQWYHALFNGQIINAASLDELSNFVSTTSSTYNYGLGLARETTVGMTYWGHGGSIWGYKSKMIYDTCNNVVVCGLTNSFPAGMDGITFILYKVTLNFLSPCQLVTGAAENESNAELNVYPNPVTDELTIETEENYTAWEISNLSGQVVLKGMMNRKAIIQTNMLPQGIYVIKLSGEAETRFAKLLKQ